MAKRKQKSSREPVNYNPPPPTRFYPAVSVVIPMYNAEKYIGECLDSLLAQTFTNFEVIVVDDCSTDNSAAIVESYVEKFDGRLKMSHLKKNSGGAPTPRNRGIKISLGDYIFFMDSDDAITPTGIEELYNLAEEFDADVVHCEKYYLAPGETVTTDKNLLNVKAIKEKNFTNVPFFDTEDLGERVKRFVAKEIWWAPWSCLIKRNVILENDIEFPKLSIADDLIFTFCVYCLAKKFLIVPNVVYVWRTLENSNCRASLSPEKLIHRRAGDIFLGIKILDEFTKGFEIFQKNPVYRYSAIDFFIDMQISYLFALYAKVPAASLDDLVRKELSSVGNNEIITAHIFGRMVTTHVNLIRNFQRQTNQFNRFAAQAQARIAELEARLR